MTPAETELSNQARLTGTVDWYRNDEGYGVIRGDDGREYFLHHTNAGGTSSFYKGEKLSFLARSRRRGKSGLEAYAIDITPAPARPAPASPKRPAAPAGPTEQRLSSAAAEALQLKRDREKGLRPARTADDARRRLLHIIEQELERMAALVANLLHFSRRSPQQFSTLDVRDEIEKTLELVHHQLRRNRITVARDFAPDAPLIQADRQHLRQLFLNLFTNASDAMPDGGTLTIRVSAPGRAVVVEVADTGVGISPDDLPRVEELFFTTKPEGRGTGLGLGICRRVMQEHGGTFDIASAGLGQGTTVRAAFPLGAGAPTN